MRFGPLGPVELILIVLVIVLIFGASKLGDIGGALGKSIREFKKEATPEEEKKAAEAAAAAATVQPAAQAQVAAATVAPVSNIPAPPPSVVPGQTTTNGAQPAPAATASSPMTEYRPGDVKPAS